jgi:hypothetical protein
MSIMLDGYRRGYMLGAELAINQPTLAVAELRSVFAWLIAYYIEKGWAHFYPLDRAIDGAIEGFTIARAIYKD